LKFVHGFWNKGQVVIYCDNFFSNPSFFQKLETNSIGTCGTERASRKGLPTDMKLQTFKTKKEDGQKFWMNDREYMITCTYQDTGWVNLPSTVNNIGTELVQVLSEEGENGVRAVWRHISASI
jgi:hypothetical protein